MMCCFGEKVAPAFCHVRRRMLLLVTLFLVIDARTVKSTCVGGKAHGGSGSAGANNTLPCTITTIGANNNNTSSNRTNTNNSSIINSSNNNTGADHNGDNNGHYINSLTDNLTAPAPSELSGTNRRKIMDIGFASSTHVNIAAHSGRKEAALTSLSSSPATGNADSQNGDAAGSIDNIGGSSNITTNSSFSGSVTNATARANSVSEPTIRPREPRYRPMVDTVVGSMVLGAILVIGVAGNAMVVAVVAQTRSMRTPTNCYLVSLSVADLIVLLSAIPNEILAQYILEDEWVFGRTGCALFVFFQYLGINVSSLSITAFTVERYIAICLPMKAQTMCTVKRAKKIILAVWFFALCYCCPWLFFLTTTKPIHYRGYEHRYIETCTYSLHRSFYMRFFFADIILFYVIPLILSCVLYGRMARVLFHTDIGAMACKANGEAKANANNQSRIQVSCLLVSFGSVQFKRIQIDMGLQREACGGGGGGGVKLYKCGSL